MLREPGSGTRSVFESALFGFGLQPADLPVALTLPPNKAVRGAVEAGLLHEVARSGASSTLCATASANRSRPAGAVLTLIMPPAGNA